MKIKFDQEVDILVLRFSEEKILESDEIKSGVILDFNRDTGWAALGSLGLESVRMVAVNEDWSALRMRRVEYVKVLTRKFDALSEEGKVKSGQKK